jgi:hypothetical protein
MHSVICSEIEYECESFQSFMDSERSSANSQWIFDLIDKKFKSHKEQVFIDKQEWCCCEDKHHGPDVRYLVVFRDKTLKTIRDLRDKHLAMLGEIFKGVIAWLISRHPNHSNMFNMYFHYMPSVFQLHLHIMLDKQHMNQLRAQTLQTVMRNIRQDSEYYKKALVLTKMCKTLKRAQTHDTVKVAI